MGTGAQNNIACIVGSTMVRCSPTNATEPPRENDAATEAGAGLFLGR